MAIQFPSGFKITSSEPIDSKLVLTKAQMKTAETDFSMPDNYFCLCKEDNKIYVFNVNNTEDAITGKFRVLASGGSTIDTYLKSAEVGENSLKLKKQDNTEVTFTTKTINGQSLVGTGNITTSAQSEYSDLSALSAVDLDTKTTAGVYKIKHATNNPEDTSEAGLLVVNALKDNKVEQDWYSSTNDAHRVIVGETTEPIPTDYFYVNDVEYLASTQTIELDSGSEYHLKGTLTNGQILVKCKYNESVSPIVAVRDYTRIYLDGVKITTNKESAITTVVTSVSSEDYKNGGEAKIEIEVSANTKNYLTSTYVSAESSSEGLIHSEGDINLSGTGYLSLVAAKSHGLKCSDLIVSGKPEIYIDAFHDGLHAKTIQIGDGKFYVKEANDAFSAGSKKNRGVLTISGGDITIEHCKENVFQAKKATEGTTTNVAAAIFIYFDAKVMLLDGFDSGRTQAFPVLFADTDGVIEVYPSVTITKPSSTVIQGLVDISTKYGSTPKIYTGTYGTGTQVTADPTTHVFTLPNESNKVYILNGNFTGYRIVVPNQKNTLYFKDVYLNDTSDDTNPFIHYTFNGYTPAAPTASSSNVKIILGTYVQVGSTFVGSAPTYLVKKNGSIIKSDYGNINFNTDTEKDNVNTSFDVYMSCPNGYCIDCAMEARLQNDGARYMVNSKYGIKANLVNIGDEFGTATYDYTKSKTAVVYCSNNETYDIGVFHAKHWTDGERDGRINVPANVYCATFLGKIVKLVPTETAYICAEKHAVTPKDTASFTRFPIVYAYQNDLTEVLAAGEASRLIILSDGSANAWTVYKHITQAELDTRYVLKSAYTSLEARVAALEQGGGTGRLNPVIDATGGLTLNNTSITDAGNVDLKSSTIDESGNVTLI